MFFCIIHRIQKNVKIFEAISALFFIGFEIVKLIRKPKEKAELKKLIQQRDEIYGKLALILTAKSSLREEQTAKDDPSHD